MHDRIASARSRRSLRGELAFDRTLKVNPNPKTDDDPKIVETLGKQFLAKRLPVNVATIKKIHARIRDEYRPLLDSKLTKTKRSDHLDARADAAPQARRS